MRFSIKSDNMSLSFFFSEINTLSVFSVLKNVSFSLFFIEAHNSSHDYIFAAKLSYSEITLQLINGLLYLQFTVFTFSSIFS